MVYLIETDDIDHQEPHQPCLQPVLARIILDPCRDASEPYFDRKTVRQ